MNLTQAVTNLDQPTLLQWLIGLREISEFIYIIPLYGFIIMLIIGYSLFTKDVLDGMIIGGFFGIFMALAMVALQMISWANVAVILAILLVGLVIKIMINS